MYSTERIVSKFEQLAGRKPTSTELNSIKESKELLSETIMKVLGLNSSKPKQLVAAGAHCKSCDD